MTDTSGISVCFGNVEDDVLLDNAKLALREMKAKWSDRIQIDTTHFVCTNPTPTPTGAQASGSTSGSPGIEYQRALQLSIPVVQPHWILACHAEKKMVPIGSFYLGVTPSAPNSATFTRPQSMSQASTPRSAGIPNTSNRASMPLPLRSATGSPPPASAFVNNQSLASPEPKGRGAHFNPVPEEKLGDDDAEEVQLERTDSGGSRRKSKTGTMNREFKFPPQSPPSSPDIPPKNAAASPPLPVHAETSGRSTPLTVIAPSSVEVPPPPPIEKERSGHTVDDESEELGETEEIALN